MRGAPSALSRLPAHALPTAVVVAGALAIAPQEGGFAASTWYPAALFVLLLVAVTLIGSAGALVRPPTAVVVALAALAGLAVLSYASIAWAVVPGQAWEGANRTALYLLAFGLAAVVAWPALTLRLVLGLVVTGLTLLAAIALLRGGGHPQEFLGGRLAYPTGYSNATAALWLMGAFPATALACDRAVPWPLRGLALAAAALLVETAVLSQSRGAALAVAVTVPVLVALTPRRLAVLGALAAVAGATAAVWTRLTAVRDAHDVPALVSRLSDARAAIFISLGVLVVLGALVAVAGRRALGPEGSPRARLVIDRVLAVAAVVAVVAGAVAVLASPGWRSARWDDFKNSGYTNVESGGTRFTGALGSNRYDFYRVALDEFKDHPFAGTGADNFAVAYLEHRRSDESPRFPHGLAFQLLAGLGAAGFVLFAVFLVACLEATRRALRGASHPARALAAGSFAGFMAWFVHGLVDWLWMFPVLGVLAVVMLAMAARAGGSRARAARRMPASRRLVIRLVAGLCGLALGVSLVAAGTAARFTAAALRPGASPAQSIARLQHAADADRLSADPLLALALIARRDGQPALAADALRRALGREPENWFAHLEAGLSDATAGRRASALAQLTAASRLNPRQPILQELVRRVRRGERPAADSVERRLNGPLMQRTRIVDPQP